MCAGSKTVVTETLAKDFLPPGAIQALVAGHFELDLASKQLIHIEEAAFEHQIILDRFPVLGLHFSDYAFVLHSGAVINGKKLAFFAIFGKVRNS